MSNGNGSIISTTTSSFSIVNVLSLIIVISYITWVPLWMFFPPTGVMPETLAIINQMMGAHGMAFATVIAFHIGSSRSAKDAQESNRETLSNLSSNVGTGTGTSRVITAAATLAAEVAAPPAAAVAAPPAAVKAVHDELEKVNEEKTL